MFFGSNVRFSTEGGDARVSNPTHQPKPKFRIATKTRPSCPRWVLCHEHAGPNGMCNCTRDGGGPFEVGNQVLVSSHRKLLWSKAMVVSVAENRNEIPAGKIERGERKQTVGEVSKAD